MRLLMRLHMRLQPPARAVAASRTRGCSLPRVWLQAFDTAFVLLKFANGKEAAIDVCRKATYGYDQRAEVLGTNAMIMTDNNYPNTAKIFSSEFCGNADMPFDFFMSRYKEAYVLETLVSARGRVSG